MEYHSKIYRCLFEANVASKTCGKSEHPTPRSPDEPGLVLLHRARREGDAKGGSGWVAGYVAPASPLT